MSSDSRPGANVRPPLVRRTDGRLLAGVCAGIAEHLRVNVVLVRVLFVILGNSGIGIFAYIAFWLLVRDDGISPIRLRRPWDLPRAVLRQRPGDDPNRRRKLFGYLLLGAIASGISGAFGLWGGHSTLPLSVAGVGALLIWWRTPQSQRDQWTQDARHYSSRLQLRGPLLVVLGGVGLVVLGVTSFLAANNALKQARDGALAIGAVLVGGVLITGPWLFRLLRELAAERRARIREHERAEVATHVHDSVLQTLALIQSRATDADAVRRLARAQERELREWLYQPSQPANGGDFSAALRAAAAEVEDTHGISIDVVVVGDAPLDDALRATVAAAREGMVNAAKSSGVATVSVFAEVRDHGVDVFVRDRGRGFDLDQVPADRRGIRESIIGRMARHGGSASVRSGPSGTEVALSVSREVPA